MQLGRASSGMLAPTTRRKMSMNKQRRRQDQVRQICLLGVLLCLVLTFLVSQISYAHQRTNQRQATPTIPKLRGNRAWVSVDSQPFNQDSVASKATHLVMVAGHSVVISGNLEEAGTDENVWFLYDYQKGQGLPQAIVAHIQAGIDEASRDPDSLLVFSGGETRAVTGPLTEASSYFRVADAMNLWPTNNNSARARTVTEEFSTDSFENLLFSVCRFKEVTGSYPTKITVVSFTFKQRRFEQLHAKAIGWPLSKFQYIGVDSADPNFDLESSRKGELENAARPFESDPYGCHSSILMEKRKARNPFSRTPPYDLTCPELKALLHYCGPQLFPKSKLPWKDLQ